MNFLYFDPGLGAMILQAVAAGVAGVLLFSKGVWFKVKSFFGLIKESTDDYDNIEVEDKETETHDKID